MRKLIIYKTMIAVIMFAAIYKANAQFYSVRINMPAILTGTFNPAFGVSLNSKTSLDFALAINPVKTSEISLQFAAVQPGVRFWLSQTNYAHFIGLHLTAAIYDVGNADFYYQGFTGGLGISYGYSWPIKKRLNIGLEVGLGVFYMTDSRHDKNVPENQDLYIYHNKRLAVAPSKLAVCLVYLF